MNRHPVNRAFPALAGLAVMAAGLTGMARASAPRPAEVTARLGPITVTASALRLSSPGTGPGTGPRGTLTATMRISTTSARPDQLDAAIAADGAPAGVYHQVISLADMPADVASCGGAVPPGGVVQRWMHYGPLTVPGRSGADAILAIQRAAPPAGGTLAVTFYFATAGPVVLRLPVSG